MSKFTSGFNAVRTTAKALGLILCLHLWMGGSLHAQETEARWSVNRISVVINGQPVPVETLSRLVDLKPGDPYTLQRVSRVIRQIYQTGLYSDVQVLREGEQQIKLFFLLTKRLVVRKIDFLSPQDIPRQKLEEGLSALTKGGAFSESRLERAKSEISELLEQEGYFDSEVEAAVQKDPVGEAVDIRFKLRLFPRYRIEAITFSGSSIIDDPGLRRKLDLKENDEYVPEILNADLIRIKELFGDLGYRRAEVLIRGRRFDSQTRSVSLNLEILPHEKIEIVVTGAEVPLSLLQPIWEVEIFEEWGLTEGEAKIIEYLREKGYLFSTVKARIERDEEKIQVVYDVTPGDRFKILDIEFKGMRYFTPDAIRSEVEIRKKIPILSSIDGARVFELPREIEFLYRTRGFPATRVDLNFEKDGGKVKPILFVQEGRQETIRTIEVEGNALFSREELLGQLNATPDGPFYQPLIRKDVDKLLNFYRNQGVRGTEAMAEVQQEEENTYSVKFKIQEGRRVRIANIVISGNNTTRDAVLQRELQVREGDDAKLDLIQETKRRIERLGVFSEVKIEEISLNPDEENLLIRVQEGEKNYAGLGVGLETKSEPRSFAVWNSVILPRGTAEFIHSNLFGSAAQISLVGQISLGERRAVISWEQPYFLGIPMQTFLNGWVEREARTSYSFDRRGISFSAIRPLSRSENMILVPALRYAKTTLYELFTPESEVDRQHFPFSATSVSGSFIWDKRDDPFNPENNFFLSSVLEWAYPLFGSESDYLKTFTKFQHYLPVASDVSFNSTIRLGLGRGRMPIHERFFGGGSNSFRGVRFDELGPKDPDSSNPIGGKALLLFNFELTFPVLNAFKNLRAVVFYDKGNVFSKRSQVSWVGLQDALGFGLRYRTPLGPVRLEVGWNLDAPENEREPLAFITIGNVF